MRPSSLAILAGPALYAAIAFALAGHAPPITLAAPLFTVVAISSLAIGAQGRPTRDASAGIGLAALGLALFAPLPPAVHAAFIVLAALGLGEAFADWIDPRLRDLSVILTAAVCLALFDLWSVKFGPAHLATGGGLLQRLLLDVPTGASWIRFLGISDLVVVVLLTGLARRRGIGPWRPLLAGLLGILACVGQAYVTRGPAPALPWIGAFFIALAWPAVRPHRAGWLRTARWAGMTCAALAVLTVIRLA